jgi:hypothetical protein
MRGPRTRVILRWLGPRIPCTVVIGFLLSGCVPWRSVKGGDGFGSSKCAPSAIQSHVLTVDAAYPPHSGRVAGRSHRTAVRVRRPTGGPCILATWHA